MSGRERPFSQVDVFTGSALLGNPLAVVHDADDLDTERMAAFARWTNLSETTFLLPPTEPGADYRVRIFTPGGELPFAGHPTLGSCAAWLGGGGRPAEAGVAVQECGVGQVRVRVDGDLLAFAAPPLTVSEAAAEVVAAARAAIGVDGSQVRAVRMLVNGPRFLTFLLDSAAAVLALEPDVVALRSLPFIGVCGLHPAGGPALLEARLFAPGSGIDEDPVTGSLQAALARWLIDEGVLPAAYVAAQGARVQRAGRVLVEDRPDGLWIGGEVTPVVTGTVRL